MGLLALAADAWLVNSSENGLPTFEKSQVAPVIPLQKTDSVKAEIEAPKVIYREDSLETTLSVTRKIQDQVLVASIEKRLFRAPELRSFDFRVKSVNGAVELSGEVSSEKEKQRALRLAQSVAGVKSVANNIEVVAPRFPTSGSNSE